MLNISALGENIKFYRKSLRLTQSELAQKLLISFQAVSNWERGAAPPDLDNIVKLSELFNVSVDKLLKQHTEYEPIYLGIDGGATKTEFVLFTPSGRVLKRIKLSGSNPNDITMEGCVGILVKGIDSCLAEHPDIAGVFAGLSGIGAGDNKAQLKSLLSERYRHLHFEIENDAINVLSSGDDSTELAIICGTGSVVYSKKKNVPVRVGGWGYLFDTAGSGYDLGRDAISACIAYEDGLGEYSAIYPLVCKKLGSKVWDSIDIIYKKGKAYIASMAPLVFEAYKSGDNLAAKIVERNIEHLGKLITVASENNPTRIVGCGGILENYSDIIIPKLLELCPKGTEITIPDLPPVYGACRECLKRFNVAENGEFHSRFLEEYKWN